MGTESRSDSRSARGGEASVAGQVDIDLVAPGTERTRERVDHIRQPAGLGERLTFRGEHRDAHRPMVRGWQLPQHLQPFRSPESCSIPRSWLIPRPSPRCPSGRCASRHSCAAWSASPTTSTGRGIPRRVRCSAASTGPRGVGSGARWRCSRSPATGPTCSTTPTSWSSTGPCSRPTTPTWRTARTTGTTATMPARSTDPSPTSVPSSGCMSPWPSTPVAWACWPATTARPRRTWRCRSWPWASSIDTATSASRSMPMATRSTRTRTWTCRTSPSSASPTRSAIR